MTSPPLSRYFSNFVVSETFGEAIPISAPCLDQQTIQCVHHCPCYRPSYEFCQSHIHRMPIQRLQREKWKTTNIGCVWVEITICRFTIISIFFLGTHCNQLDYDTLGMAIVPSANMARFFLYYPDTNIRPVQAHKPARIVGKVLPMADGLYKLWCVLGSLNASVMWPLGNRSSYRDHCQEQKKHGRLINVHWHFGSKSHSRRWLI